MNAPQSNRASVNQLQLHLQAGRPASPAPAASLPALGGWVSHLVHTCTQGGPVPAPPPPVHPAPLAGDAERAPRLQRHVLHPNFGRHDQRAVPGGARQLAPRGAGAGAVCRAAPLQQRRAMPDARARPPPGAAGPGVAVPAPRQAAAPRRQGSVGSTWAHAGYLAQRCRYCCHAAARARQLRQAAGRRRLTDCVVCGSALHIH